MVKLTTQQIAELTATGSTEGAVDGVHWTGIPNLYVQVRGGNASWLLRWNVRGRNRAMGLGSVKTVTYTSAQAEAVKWIAVVRAGGDPIATRKAERAGHVLPASSSSGAPTFRAVARDYIANHEQRWRDPHASMGWSRRLRQHVYPIIGDLPVDAVSVDHVVDILKPLWHEQPPTAEKVRTNISRVLEWAEAHGHRTGRNPAHWSGALPVRPGGRPRHVVQHFKAVPVSDAPALYAALAAQQGTPARAVRFQHLTVVRPAEARSAHWEDVDLQHRIWTIPAERMKGGRHEHRVPLADEALAVLEDAGPRNSGLVFPSAVNGLLAPSGWHKVIKRTGFDVTAHGVRSTFADWCREVAGVDRELRELNLAHREKSEVVKAYARSDLLEQRRPVMARWADFLTGKGDSDG